MKGKVFRHHSVQTWVQSLFFYLFDTAIFKTSQDFLKFIILSEKETGEKDIIQGDY